MVNEHNTIARPSIVVREGMIELRLNEETPFLRNTSLDRDRFKAREKAGYCVESVLRPYYGSMKKQEAKRKIAAFRSHVPLPTLLLF